MKTEKEIVKNNNIKSPFMSNLEYEFFKKFKIEPKAMYILTCVNCEFCIHYSGGCICHKHGDRHFLFARNRKDALWYIYKYYKNPELVRKQAIELGYMTDSHILNLLAILMKNASCSLFNVKTTEAIKKSVLTNLIQAVTNRKVKIGEAFTCFKSDLRKRVKECFDDISLWINEENCNVGL